jgi:hypothetical protein
MPERYMAWFVDQTSFIRSIHAFNVNFLPNLIKIGSLTSSPLMTRGGVEALRHISKGEQVRDLIDIGGSIMCHK